MLTSRDRRPPPGPTSNTPLIVSVMVLCFVALGCLSVVLYVRQGDEVAILRHRLIEAEKSHRALVLRLEADAQERQRKAKAIMESLDAEAKRDRQRAFDERFHIGPAPDSK